MESPTKVVHLLQSMNQHWHIIITQSSQFPSGFPKGIAFSMSFGKYVILWNYHYNIIQENFAVLKIHPVCFIYSPLPPWKILATADLFTLSVVLTYPECQRVRNRFFLKCIRTLQASLLPCILVDLSVSIKNIGQ